MWRQEDLLDALDDVLVDGVERGAAAGVATVVVDRAGTRYEGAFGERNLGSGVAMTVDSVGAIASMTKLITGAAVMQLVEQGRLDLDAPAMEVLPELSDLVVLEGFGDDGQPRTRPATVPVTLRHLLTHTSGFVYDIWDDDLTRWHEVTGAPSAVLSGQRAALSTPLAFEPGTRWQYGTGIEWAGLMIEQVSGVSLGEFLATELCGPLGMADTAFAPSASMIDRFTGLHARMPDGALTPIEMVRPEAADYEMGGGGLLSTVRDYGRFIQMILNDGAVDGTHLLAQATVEEMSSNHIGELLVDPLITAAPELSHDAEFFAGDPKSWGLTFQINNVEGHTGRPAGTLMWAGLMNSYCWIDRTNGVGGAFLTQILPFADPAALDLYYRFEAATYAHT